MYINFCFISFLRNQLESTERVRERVAVIGFISPLLCPHLNPLSVSVSVSFSLLSTTPISPSRPLHTPTLTGLVDGVCVFVPYKQSRVVLNPRRFDSLSLVHRFNFSFLPLKTTTYKQHSPNSVFQFLDHLGVLIT